MQSTEHLVQSPWSNLRSDEAIRAEIEQDVRRLPDEATYHSPRVQRLILDVLFVYCRLNPAVGGYRQGMHELLAPIVRVVSLDAVDRTLLEADPTLDSRMLDVLDDRFVEHDVFALFAKLMDRASAFYEVADPPAPAHPAVRGSHSALETHRQQQQRQHDAGAQSRIVERSRVIHETCLAAVDPELAQHLKAIEILPQIFLM